MAELPRFATDPSADVEEPSEPKKDLGWVAGEAPSAAHMNWLHKNTYDYLEDIDTRQSADVTNLGNYLASRWTTGPMPESGGLGGSWYSVTWSPELQVFCA